MFSKKKYLFGAANVKSQKGMILAGELQFYQFPIGISLLTRRLILLRDFLICICDEMSFF